MIVVSIGLIKARILNAELMVKDLMSGSLKPDKIIFCVSKEPYLLDKGIQPNELPKINNPKVEFKYVENFGPLRRISPIVEEYYDRPDTKIIIFDDDRKPAIDTLQKLVAFSNKYPNIAVAAAGNVWGGNKQEYINNGVIYEHRHKHINGIVLGWAIKKHIEVHVANPGVGLLVKPKFFSKDFFKWKEYYDDEYYGISMTDQTFINYSMAKNGIRRFVIPLNYVSEYNSYGVGLVHINKCLDYKIKQLKLWKDTILSNKPIGIRVRIVPLKDGWILDKIGEYLINGIDYAVVDLDFNKPYDLTYFMHYSMVRPCNSKIVGAYFTHRANKQFEEKAKEVNFAVCMNERYKKVIENITDNYVIYQPTDLEKFKPKLVLGFSGILNSGRKGKDLLDMVTKLPFVDLKMTLGKGLEKNMNKFYNSLDYILITSTIEGGPMSLTEGLACGKEIITSDVGMVDQFKDCKYVHIYDRNKPETLTNLLKELYQKKLEIRKTVEKYSIKNFVDEHKKLFEKLVNEQIR